MERTYPKHTYKMLVEIWILKKWNFFLKDFIKENSLKISLKNANKKFLIIKKKISFFQNPYFNQHLASMFRVCSFSSETFQDDIFNLDINLRRFSIKLEMRFLQHISLLQQEIPLFLPRSWDMIKPSLELCRVDPEDVFTYLSWSHIMSTSNFRIREKKFSIFHFYAYFLKRNFKELPEKLLLARFQLFLVRILKMFL